MTDRRYLLRIGLLALWSCIWVLGSHAAEKPNVILILADDLGWGDPQCYNPESKIPTPHMDRIAKEGMRFTDAHTPSSVCTPTRYGLLTGRYCWRTWLKKSVLDGFGPPLITMARPTIASILKDQGYATACIGKWHLGMRWFDTDGKPMGRRGEKERFRPGTNVDFKRPIEGGPLSCGFETYFGISASLDMSPYCFIEGKQTVGIPDQPSEENRDKMFLNQVAGVKAADFTLEGVLPALKKRAVQWIEAQGKKPDQPMFLYLPLNSPHLPAVPNEAFRGKSGAGVYGDFVFETDDCIGAVLDALDRTGQAENTLVIVTSDNGGLWHQWEPKEADDVKSYKPTPRADYTAEFDHQSNAHLRGTKADIWEGGHRVPFLVRWPGHVKEGSVSPALVCLTDVMATLLEILDQPKPDKAGQDSQSFLAALEGSPKGRTSVIHHSLDGTFALRTGPWKYCESRGSHGFSRPRDVEPVEGEASGQLYHLGGDVSETTNVWLENPERVQRLKAALSAVRRHVVGRDPVVPGLRR